jgi:hypothetical protein
MQTPGSRLGYLRLDSVSKPVQIRGTWLFNPAGESVMRRLA